MLEEDEARLHALRERVLALRWLYNNAALVNAKLPVELRVAIFRSAGRLTTPLNAIWLTHVCHAWRSLIHSAPCFWTDFLNPPPGHRLTGSTMNPFALLGALSWSAPMRFTLGLYGDLLPALQTPAAEAHLSRMTGMYLDCRSMEDNDMRPFFYLSLLSLESLELWLDCSTLLRLRDLSADSPARFPRLRSLKTTCTSFALAWVGSTLRLLHILAMDEEATTPAEARLMRCCPLRSVSRITEVLDSFAHPPSTRLDHLKSLEIGDDVEDVRSLLERCTLPRDTVLTIHTDSEYDAISGFLPVKNPLQLPLVRQVKVAVCRPAQDYPHTVQGSAPDADGTSLTRLTVFSTDQSIMYPGRDVDLLRLFRGFAPCFSPVDVVDLSINIGKPVQRGQSAAWTWLMRNFPRLTHLSVEATAIEDFFSALAQDDVVPELATLRVALTGPEDAVVPHEEMVTALELRASRGVRLRLFVYRRQMNRERFGELPSPLPVPYVRRLQAVVATMFDDCISSQERACLGGLSPAEAQVDENEEINNLHEPKCGLRRLYNSAASINAKLPVEILIEIFRLAGPSFGPKEAIRLTHNTSHPRETFITICTDSSYDALSEFLPAKDTLLALPLIHQVAVSGCRPEEVYPHTVYGFAEAADEMYQARLAVLSSDKSVLHPWGRREVRDTIDLLRFFRGFAPIFSPAAVVGLYITLCGPVQQGQSEAWVWLLRYFPRITDLAIELSSSKDFSSALAQEDVVLELSNLQLTLIGAEDWAVADEAIVSALELRASRGVRLTSFLFRQQVLVGYGHATDLPCPLPVPYVKRLQAVVKEVTMPLSCYVY
ncbi:hypothetical protein K466DRAFT_662804 [Polyporus arcularius HHB13444]|uniref:F-box domain-containing protein n=1 Tax=Polyporus arcularius HHB13444 TaxID=1314778 RepID=A0A5C3PFC6_9APHY|nr:hypothetical protein K466DRAFT_662804 [Polyporus arcularius HHB13444]